MGKNPEIIEPLCPGHLIMDHSVQIDHYGNAAALRKNMEIEFKRNRERYQFLKWSAGAFKTFQIIPPGNGICPGQSRVLRGGVTGPKDGTTWAFPDTVFGTDSHTTMINGIGVLGWGVGGIEAEAAMLGQPSSMLIPQVVGFKLTGRLPEGSTATDLVLTVTQMLRKHGVVGKFVEFFGDGLQHLPLADRATIANMAPEYGATCGIFPIDAEALTYLRLSGRDEKQINLVEAYAKAQDLFQTQTHRTRNFPPRWNWPRRCKTVSGRTQAPAGSRSARRCRELPRFARLRRKPQTESGELGHLRAKAEQPLSVTMKAPWLKASTCRSTVRHSNCATVRSLLTRRPRASTRRIQRSCSAPACSRATP
jgi:hypothetical protein